MIGEGKLWDEETNKFVDADIVLKKKPFYKPVDLLQKEGIAFINGTQFMTATGIEALIRAERLLKNYLVIYALTFEILGGNYFLYFFP